MEYIQNLYHFAQDYWFLTIIIGLLASFIESFLPILPLMAIVGANAILLGLFGGLVLSWIGSGLGTGLLFMLISKFDNHKILDRFKNEKVDKAIRWMDKKGFKLIFFAYACPFAPSFLVTVAASLCKVDYKDFLPAMLSGKFIMFLFVSYPASDIKGFISSPTKIIIFCIAIFLSWTMGNKLKKSLEKHEHHEKHEKHAKN